MENDSFQLLIETFGLLLSYSTSVRKVGSLGLVLNRTGQAVRAYTGFRQQENLLFQEIPDLC